MGYGLTLLDLSDVSISDSAISGVGEDPYVGIWCEHTRYVNLYDVTVEYGDTGIYFLESSNIEISYNEISLASSYGVLLENVSIVDIWLNNITSNYVGLHAKPKENMDSTIKIYMNDFENNYPKHAEDEGSVVWNDIVGNYWSGIEIVDSDQDNISDIPYAIDQDSKDLMPLTCSVWTIATQNPQVLSISTIPEVLTRMDLYHGFGVIVEVLRAFTLEKVTLECTIEGNVIAKAEMTFSHRVGIKQYYRAHVIAEGSKVSIAHSITMKIKVHVKDIFGKTATGQKYVNILSAIKRAPKWRLRILKVKIENLSIELPPREGGEKIPIGGRIGWSPGIGGVRAPRGETGWGATPASQTPTEKTLKDRTAYSCKIISGAVATNIISNIFIVLRPRKHRPE